MKNLPAIALLACALLAACSLEGRTALPDGVVGLPYRASVPVSVGTPPLNWVIVEGRLPDGLALNAVTGEISGTPTKAGDFDFTVNIRDSASPPQNRPRELSIRVVLP